MEHLDFAIGEFHEMKMQPSFVREDCIERCGVEILTFRQIERHEAERIVQEHKQGEEERTREDARDSSRHPR